MVFVQTYDGFCGEQLHLVRSLQNVGSSLANWLKKDFDYHNYDRENFLNRSLKGVKNLPLIYIIHQSLLAIEMILITEALIQR